MPHKDAEQGRAYQRRYAAENAERKRLAAKRWRDENLERSRESRRRYVQEHYEEVLEDQRARYWANRDQANEGRRVRRRQPGGKTPKERLRDEIIGPLWHEQEGCCYLCGGYVPLERAVLEHDHRCCPLGAFCRFCIRGVSCQACNCAIGYVGDDPDRLEVMALNLRARLDEVTRRLAEKPEQLDLGA